MPENTETKFITEERLHDELYDVVQHYYEEEVRQITADDVHHASFRPVKASADWIVEQACDEHHEDIHLDLPGEELKAVEDAIEAFNVACAANRVGSWWGTTKITQEELDYVNAELAKLWKEQTDDTN